MQYIITLDNEDGTKEIIKRIDCTKDAAYEAFIEIVKKQSQEYHVDKTLTNWRVVRLLDANNTQIAQES